jgi:NitT/TauT family transport system substrate-binding protein
MLAMTRYSVTDLLGELAVDSAKLKPEQVFRIQVYDVTVRMKMLENNEMDAMWISEPQLSQLLLAKHRVLLDTRQLDYQMGVIAFTTKDMQDKNRKRQMEVFIKGYQAACDAIDTFGIAHYRDLIVKYCQVKSESVELLDKNKFVGLAKPRQQDIERAQKWLSKK